MWTAIGEGYNPPPVARVKKPRPTPASPPKSGQPADPGRCEKCGNSLSIPRHCDLCGYEGMGVLLGGSLPSYNMLCLKEDGSHPPFPFELWGFIAFIVRSETDLEQAIIENNAEEERRRIARI